MKAQLKSVDLIDGLNLPMTRGAVSYFDIVTYKEIQSAGSASKDYTFNVNTYHIYLNDSKIPSIPDYRVCQTRMQDAGYN